MRVLMIAPPGAGKGTQGALIATHFDIPHIATGELLRDHVARRTALGLAVQEYLDRGELVPDQVVLDMLREELIAAKAAGGAFVLDGIPRNMHQARAVYLIGRELGMTADVALHLQADDEELMRRLLARAALEHRSDDTTDIIAQRLALYHAVTSPIVSWYRDRGILVSLDAMRSAQQVGREILTALEAMRPFLDHVPGQTRLSVDLTGLGDAFGAADSTAGTSDLADGLHRRPPRLVGAGWLDPGERRRAGCRVPRWPAACCAGSRGQRRRWLREVACAGRPDVPWCTAAASGRVGGERGEGAGHGLGHGRVVQPEDGYEACDLAGDVGGGMPAIRGAVARSVPSCPFGIVQSAAPAAALGVGDEVGQRAGAAGEHPGEGGGAGMGRSAGSGAVLRKRLEAVPLRLRR